MQEDGRGYRPLPSSPESRGDTRSTGVTIARVALERGTAARAVARGARQAGAALGTELGVGLGAGTVGGTRGTRDGGRGRSGHRGETHPPFHVPRPRLRAECRQGCRRVFGLQFPVIAVGEFPRRAIEFDLFQSPECDGAGTEVVLRVLALAHVSCFLIPVSGCLGSKDRPQDEIHGPRGEQDPGRELEHAAQEGSRSSSRRRRASSSGVAPASPSGAAGRAARTQRRSTSVRATAATTMANEGTKYPARLNPRFGGAMRMAMPWSRTN